jgi:hypothetical protein
MRDINWDKPLSKADVEWAMQREELHAKVKANQEKFSKSASSDLASTDADPEEGNATPADDYDQWKLAELRDEAASRRPAVDVTDLKTAEVIAAMRKWDAAHPEG